MKLHIPYHSKHGSSELKSSFCEQLYVYKKAGLVGDGPGNTGRARGTAMHLVMAHHWKRIQAIQEGRDPDEWYPPLEALQVARGRGVVVITDEVSVQVAEMYARNFRSDDPRAPRVLHVEESLPIDCGVLDCPGHPDHGQPIIYESVMDLVVHGVGKDAGSIYLDDYKNHARVTPRERDGYQLDWQFVMMALTGSTYFGDAFRFPRVRLFDYDKQAHTVEPIHVTRHLVSRATARYARRRHRLAQLDLELAAGADPYAVDAALTETACSHRYGLCDGYQLCHKGPKC